MLQTGRSGPARRLEDEGFEAYPEILIGIPCHCVGGTTGKAVGAVAVYIWILP